MTIEEINKIKSFQISERQKLEMIFGKYIDIIENHVIHDITKFDELLGDIMRFYAKDIKS